MLEKRDDATEAYNTSGRMADYQAAKSADKAMVRKSAIAITYFKRMFPAVQMTSDQVTSGVSNSENLGSQSSSSALLH